MGNFRANTLAGDWPWSRAAAHLAAQGTPYVDIEPALIRVDTIAAFVAAEPKDGARWSDLPRAKQVGRPVWAKTSIEALEKHCGRPLAPDKRGGEAAALGFVE